jgi:dTDP-glucose 4,6-dehydratase
MKSTIFVLGSNSFSGSNYINLLLEKKYKVIGISRGKEINPVYLKYKTSKNLKLFKFYKLDLNKNLNQIIKLIKKKKPKTIVNFIAQGMVAESWKNPQDWYKTNIVSQVNFYNSLLKLKFIKKMIHVTTPEVFGSNIKKIKESTNFNPNTPYAISRATLDIHLKKYQENFKLPIIFTRTSNVYGPHQQLYRIIPKTIMCEKKKIKLNLHGGGKSLRSFIFIDDSSRATLKIMNKGKIGETYHISTNEFLTINMLVVKLSKLLESKFKNLVKITKDRIGKDHSYKLDSNKLRKLKWQDQVNLDNGLKLTLNWIEKNFQILKSHNLNYKHKK